MDQLAIEQKIYGNGRQPAGIQQGGKSSANLGGFAISFEELLQRVGARIEHGFSAVDQGSHLSNAARRESAGYDRRDAGADRDRPVSDRKDSRDGRGDRGDERTKVSAVDRNDVAARTDGADASARDGVDAAGQNTGDDGHQTDRHAEATDNRSDDGAGKQATDDTQGNAGNEAKADDGAQTQQAGNEANNGSASQGDQHAAQQHAVSAYAAGAVGAIVSEHATSANAGAATDEAGAQKIGPEVAEVAQAATGKKAAHAPEANGQHASQNRNPAAQQNAQAQQAAQAADPARDSAIRDQAQQLSRAIGEGNKANVNVTVNNEQSQLTSKPTQSIANTSVLTADGSGNSQTGQQAQSGTQHQANPNAAAAVAQAQQTQQAANAGQQQQAANVQQVQAANGAGDARGAMSTATQATGGATQHAGGGEGTSNTQSTQAGTQQTQQSQQTKEAAQTHAQQAPRSQMLGQPVVDQISVKITKALQAGNDRISIQLKPEDLGRVDVKMELSHDGRVSAVVTADKQETLDLLKRDASELQRALADAGLKTDVGDMQFNLRGDQGQTAGDEGGRNTSAAEQAEAEAEEQAVGDGVLAAWESGIYHNGKLDVRA